MMRVLQQSVPDAVIYQTYTASGAQERSLTDRHINQVGVYGSTKLTSDARYSTSILSFPPAISWDCLLTYLMRTLVRLLFPISVSIEPELLRVMYVSKYTCCVC